MMFKIINTVKLPVVNLMV